MIEKKSSSPAEDWLHIIHELIGLLQSKNALQEKGNAPETNRYFILEFLREMMPTWEQSKCLDQ